MKKLMIAAAIVCAAAFANAAQCQWNVTGIAPDKTGTALTGYKLYLCDSAVVSIAALSENLAKGVFTDLEKSGFVQQTAGSVAQGATGNAKISATQYFGDYTIGDTKSFYTLVLNGVAGNATEFMTSASVTATVPGTGNLMMSFLNASQTGSGWQSISSGPTPVPEPTSGLLLLLGMAGLALRRRRA